MLHETTIVDGSLRDADLAGALLRHCRLDNTDLTGVNTNQLRHVHSGDYLPTPPPPVRTRLQSLTGHTGPVWGVAFSPDGTQLATAGDDVTARIWDADAGQPDLLMASFTKTSTASWSQVRDTLLSTTGDAWLFLRAARLDSQNRVVDLQPYELYYSESTPTTAS